MCKLNQRVDLRYLFHHCLYHIVSVPSRINPIIDCFFPLTSHSNNVVPPSFKLVHKHHQLLRYIYHKSARSPELHRLRDSELWALKQCSPVVKSLVDIHIFSSFSHIFLETPYKHIYIYIYIYIYTYIYIYHI